MGWALTDQLDALNQGQRGPIDADLKVTLARLASEVKSRVDKASPASFDFLSAALKSISRVRGSTHADIRMACLFECAGYFMANRTHHEALECGRQLESLARKAGDDVWLRKGVMLQGVVYGLLGDCGQGVHQLSRSLAMVREQGELVGEASVLNNLGTTLNYAGLYREAIPCFTKAIEIARKEPTCPRSFEASALCNLAQTFFSLGEPRKGLVAITESLRKSEEPTKAFDALSRAIREYTYVQLSLEVGQISAAREHSRKCYLYARAGGAKAQFLAELSGGLCEIHGGDVDKGVVRLEQSVSTSDQKGSVEHIDALNALIRAYDHAYQPERALEHLTVLIETIKERRQKSIEALITLDSKARYETIASEEMDLSALASEQARLRAVVAEREIVNSRIEMLERFAITADLKEDLSGEHGYRVGRLSSLFCTRLGWTTADCHWIETAARLHDIGKVAIPDRILFASTELQAAERHFMSTHTTIGAELLGKSNIPQLRMAEEIARHHHEWWNGEGYPSKLKGKRIPIHARIVALADVFDALTHGRPFSPPWSIERALDEIRARKGTQFDPELTDLFLELVDRLRKEHQDLDEYLGRAGKSSPFLQARNRIRQMLADERENEKKATVAGNETRH